MGRGDCPERPPTRRGTVKWEFLTRGPWPRNCALDVSYHDLWTVGQKTWALSPSSAPDWFFLSAWSLCCPRGSLVCANFSSFTAPSQRCRSHPYSFVSIFSFFLCPTQVCGEFLAFWEVGGLLPVFSRYSVGVVPHVDVFLMYLWGGRWSARLIPPPSWRSPPTTFRLYKVNTLSDQGNNFKFWHTKFTFWSINSPCNTELYNICIRETDPIIMWLKLSEAGFSYVW